ncbi:cytochrome P450 [Lanmaoa asiatica]|nr:cytochrome P450 [Lanmaoa asiatica]
MDVAEGEERTAKLLTPRVLALNFASLHSTAQSFTHALFYLAANPQYIQPLREEVEAIINQEGEPALERNRIRQVTSYSRTEITDYELSESLARKAMKDFTFSDGTFIPKGTLISAASGCIHLDDDFYENAAIFDPFRFARMREAVGEGTKHQFVSTSLEYLPFGHGRNACPGRFFVANELKVMLAHIVLSYDVKSEENMTIPESIHATTSITANPDAKIMFRKRNF